MTFNSQWYASTTVNIFKTFQFILLKDTMSNGSAHAWLQLWTPLWENNSLFFLVCSRSPYWFWLDSLSDGKDQWISSALIAVWISSVGKQSNSRCIQLYFVYSFWRDFFFTTKKKWFLLNKNLIPENIYHLFRFNFFIYLLFPIKFPRLTLFLAYCKEWHSHFCKLSVWHM